MKVLILGGGTVGSTIAQFLCTEGHSVTIVDQNQEVLARLDTELDARAVYGNASVASTLFKADVASQDLCLALTNSHEVNLVASDLAKTMGAKRTAARVYAEVFKDLHRVDYRKCFRVDRFLGIEYLTAMEIARLIRDPGSMMIEHFAQGYAEMQEVVILRPSSATGVPLEKLKLPGTVRIGSINRDGRISIATASDTINPGDRITILGETQGIEGVKKLFEIAPSKRKKVLIAGGGEVALNLVDVLKKRGNTITLLESNRERSNMLSRELQSSATVLLGDARRRSVLMDTRPNDYDYFVAATGDDETNIMCCLEAKSVGAATAIAVVKHSDYGGMVKKLGIDITVSPFEVVRRQVEGLLHTGALSFANPYLLGHGIDVVELTAQENSPITASPLKECGIPRQALLAAVVREATPQLPSADFRIQPGDMAVALVHKEEEQHLVELFTDQRAIPRQSKESLAETLIKSLGK